MNHEKITRLLQYQKCTSALLSCVLAFYVDMVWCTFHNVNSNHNEQRILFILLTVCKRIHPGSYDLPNPNNGVCLAFVNQLIAVPNTGFTWPFLIFV